MSCAGAGAASPPRRLTAQTLSSHPVPANRRWRALVEGPTSADHTPVRIVSATGDISDPQALIHPHPGEVTTITFQAGHTLPVLVLDYGKEVAGFPRFDVAAATSTAM